MKRIIFLLMFLSMASVTQAEQLVFISFQGWEQKTSMQREKLGVVDQSSQAMEKLYWGFSSQYIIVEWLDENNEVIQQKIMQDPRVIRGVEGEGRVHNGVYISREVSFFVKGPESAAYIRTRYPALNDMEAMVLVSEL